MPTNYFTPDNVLVVTFGEDPENDKNAYQALTDLKQLDSQDQIKIAGAAVVTREANGRVDVKSEVGEDPYVGTASGGLIGLLVGIIGGPLGVLLGGATGVLVGSLFDIDEVETTESVLERDLEAGSADADGGPGPGHRAEPRGDRRRDGAAGWRGHAPPGRRCRGGDRRGRRGAAQGQARGPQGAPEGSRREDARQDAHAKVEELKSKLHRPKAGDFRITATQAAARSLPGAPPPSWR